MSDASRTLDAEGLRALLARVGECAVARGVELELVALGGAAIALQFGTRRVTRDIDVIEARPSREVLAEIAAVIAGEYNLSPRWLSDDAARFAPKAVRGALIYSKPGIKLYSVALEQLLASKLDAMRDDVDRADAIAVAARLGLNRTSTELAIAPHLRAERYKRACEELADIWDEVESAR